MALPFQYTYARNSTLAKIKSGKAGPIRISGLKGNMNIDQPWMTIEDAAGGTANSTMPNYGDVPLDHFSSTCLYFGDSLADGLTSYDDTGVTSTPIGLIHTVCLSIQPVAERRQVKIFLSFTLPRRCLPSETLNSCQISCLFRLGAAA